MNPDNQPPGEALEKYCTDLTAMAKEGESQRVRLSQAAHILLCCCLLLLLLLLICIIGC